MVKEIIYGRDQNAIQKGLLYGINILLADDNTLNQKIVSLILTKFGGVVSVAGNGKEVIALLGQYDFDIILMDMYMPVMDGIVTAKYLREEIKTDIPIIALTADKFIVETELFLQAGINGFIAKPFDTGNLCDMIVKLVHQNKCIHS